MQLTALLPKSQTRGALSPRVSFSLRGEAPLRLSPAALKQRCDVNPIEWLGENSTKIFFGVIFLVLTLAILYLLFGVPPRVIWDLMQ